MGFAIFTSMKRFLFLLLVGGSLTTMAQQEPHFLQGFGYDYSIGVPRNNSGQLFMGNGASYVLRYIKPVNENLSYGVGLPIGASLVQSLVSGAAAIGANYAISADLHAGMGATELSNNLVGGFFGLGFGSYDVYYVDLYGTTRDAHYGPYVHAGLRIPYYGQNITLAVANWRGMNAQNGRSQVFAIKFIYEFL